MKCNRGPLFKPLLFYFKSVETVLVTVCCMSYFSVITLYYQPLLLGLMFGLLSISACGKGR